MTVDEDTLDIEEALLRAELRAHTLSSALAWWGSVLGRLRSGEDVARDRADAVLGLTSGARLRAARWYYDERVFARLAALSPVEVGAQLSPWLETAIEVAAADVCNEESRAEAVDLLTAMVQAPYVVIVGNPEPWYAQPFPDPRVAYGDLYEATASGASCGPSTIWLAKSTGEPFRPAERRSACAGMRADFLGNAADDGEDDEAWAFSIVPSADDRVVEAAVEPDF